MISSVNEAACMSCTFEKKVSSGLFTEQKTDLYWVESKR